MTHSASLRLRLIGIILVPLMVIALLVGVWQWRDLRQQAADLFDRSLLTTALAISADIARTGGSALSLETRDLLQDTSDGPVYYHAYAPDGVYVTGYATPPVRPPEMAIPERPYFYFESTSYGRPVRVLRLYDVTTIDGITGRYTYTVWQELSVREALLQRLSLRAFIVIAVLIGTVALVVWFGVRLGLRPLIDLEDAISRRNSDDLSPIRRAVPVETRGLVARLNTLFGQVAEAMATQTVFISNAAHQLRNPIAGVLAMAEAVRSAPTEAEARRRSGELLSAARHVKDLDNKLLTLERAGARQALAQDIDLVPLLQSVAETHRDEAGARGVALSLALPAQAVTVRADPVMLEEALTNLLDNALRHGGQGLSRIELSLDASEEAVTVTVRDDGIGIAPDKVETALSRFGQANPGEGSGLGLSIAEAVATRGGGSLDLRPADPRGLQVVLRLPAMAASGQRPAA